MKFLSIAIPLFILFAVATATHDDMRSRDRRLMGGSSRGGAPEESDTPGPKGEIPDDDDYEDPNGREISKVTLGKGSPSERALRQCVPYVVKGYITSAPGLGCYKPDCRGSSVMVGLWVVHYMFGHVTVDGVKTPFNYQRRKNYWLNTKLRGDDGDGTMEVFISCGTTITSNWLDIRLTSTDQCCMATAEVWAARHFGAKFDTQYLYNLNYQRSGRILVLRADAGKSGRWYGKVTW